MISIYFSLMCFVLPVKRIQFVVFNKNGFKMQTQHHKIHNKEKK